MEGELELLSLRSEKLTTAGAARAASIVDEFYDELRATHSLDDETDVVAASPSMARRNQQALYVQERRRSAAAVASQRHLEAHPEWLSGRRALDTEDLRAMVMMQHLTLVDVEDLSLPLEERRSEDEFTESGISHQLLLDAGRSEFRLLGKELSFQKELAARGASLEKSSLEVEQLLREYEQRIATELLECLGDAAPRELVQALSRTMSQSGMANLERACAGQHIVISGGEQTLRYDLTAPSPGVWEVTALMRKFDFDQFVIVDEACIDEPGKVHVLECSTKSQIVRGFTLRYEVAAGSQELRVDALDLIDRVEILDNKGKRMSLPGQKVRSRACVIKDFLTQRSAEVVKCLPSQVRCIPPSPHRPLVSMLSRLAARCATCRRRRVRGAAQDEHAKVSRMVCGTEDPEESMRVPLQEMPV